MGFLGNNRPDVRKLARRGRLDSVRDALRYSEVFVGEDGREWDAAVQVRVDAARALGQLDATLVADDLVAALDDRAPQVRVAAVEALAGLEPRVAGVLERLLELVVTRRPGDGAVAAYALDTLAGWRSHEATGLLIERLLSPTAPAPDEGHRDALRRLLESDARGPDAREAAAGRVLAELGAARDGEVMERAAELFAWLGPEAVDRLLRSLEEGNVTPGKLRAAGLSGDARAVGPVTRGLKDQDAATRKAAAEAANALVHTKTVPALLAATQDEDVGVRNAASAALDRMGTAAVIAGLAAVVDARALLDVNGAELKGALGEPPLDAHAARALGAGDGDRAAAVATPAPGPAPAHATSAPPPPPGPARPRRVGLLDRLLGGRDV